MWNSYLIAALTLISCTAWAGDPRDDAKLEQGQPYKTAKKNLLKLGFKIGPTNLDLQKPIFDKKFPEVACGHIKNEMVDHDVCVVLFENKKKGFLNLELKRTPSGDFILDEL